MKAQNKKLHTAKEEKKDEFYTQMGDINNEVKNYQKHFENKIVYCNCDDPEKSFFFRYFAKNFDKLKLKKLITTHFVYKDIFIKGQTYKLEITEQMDVDDDGEIHLPDSVKTPLL